MEKYSEMFVRAALHDLANVLAGVRGIIDLSTPGEPFSDRDRARLDAVLDEGALTMERCRHLALGTFPDATLEPAGDWRDQLKQDIAPLERLFRCPIHLSLQGERGFDQWPGARMRGLVHAITRLVLPQARGGALTILGTAGPRGWLVLWQPVGLLPDGLAEGPEDRSRDICARWALACARQLAAEIDCRDGALRLRAPLGEHR